MIRSYKNLPIIKYLFLALGIYLAATSLFVLLRSISISAVLCVILGLIFIAASIFYDVFANSPRVSTRILRYLVVFGTCAWFVGCAGLFLYGNIGNPTYTEDVLIVTGCGGVSSSGPSRALRKRLDKAIDYLNTNPYAYIVVSGSGSNHSVTEADIMAVYLQKNNIESSRIIKETKSKNMLDRFKQSKKLIDSRFDDEYHCVTITSAAQALRAQLMARRCSLITVVDGVSTDFLQAPSHYMHEALAIIRLILFKY